MVAEQPIKQTTINITTNWVILKNENVSCDCFGGQKSDDKVLAGLQTLPRLLGRTHVYLSQNLGLQAVLVTGTSPHLCLHDHMASTFSVSNFPLFTSYKYIGDVIGGLPK